VFHSGNVVQFSISKFIILSLQLLKAFCCMQMLMPVSNMWLQSDTHTDNTVILLWYLQIGFWSFHVQLWMSSFCVTKEKTKCQVMQKPTSLQEGKLKCASSEHTKILKSKIGPEFFLRCLCWLVIFVFHYSLVTVQHYKQSLQPFYQCGINIAAFCILQWHLQILLFHT